MTDTVLMRPVGVQPVITEARWFSPASEAALLLNDELKVDEGYVLLLALVYVPGAVAKRLAKVGATSGHDNEVHHFERALENKRRRAGLGWHEPKFPSATSRRASSNQKSSSRPLADAEAIAGCR